jgi:exopolysaccharide biosynthesis polyprenyl glycosylphosphotransferase
MQIDTEVKPSRAAVVVPDSGSFAPRSNTRTDTAESLTHGTSRAAHQRVVRAPEDWIVRRSLLAADALAVTLALLVEAVAFPAQSRDVAHLALLLAYAPLTICIARAHGLDARDQRRADHTTADDLVGILQAVTLSSWLMLTVAIASGVGLGDARPPIVTWGTTILLMTVLRATARTGRRRRESYVQNTVIVGAGEIGQVVADKLLRNPQFGCRLVGFIDANPRGRPQTLMDIPMLGGLERLSEVIRDLSIERVMIAFSEDSQLSTLEVLRSVAGHSVHVDIVPRLFEVLGPRANMHALEGLPLIGIPPRLAAPLMSGAKRIIDLVAATVALAVLWPILVVIALRIKLDSPGPALYWSVRIGRNGRPFDVCKFRTMNSEDCRGERYGAATAEAHFAQMMSDTALGGEFEQTRKFRQDSRVTRFGARLRRSYLDELPQLWNVMRGDLSLVGPRPITAEEFVQFEVNRHPVAAEPVGVLCRHRLPGYWELGAMRPGVTGYWQITGGSEVGYDERLRLDLLYAADWSLKLDLLIAVKTLTVLARRGAC